jgi:hypothetical protein
MQSDTRSMDQSAAASMRGGVYHRLRASETATGIGSTAVAHALMLSMISPGGRLRCSPSLAFRPDELSDRSGRHSARRQSTRSLLPPCMKSPVVDPRLTAGRSTGQMSMLATSTQGNSARLRCPAR